MNGERKRQAFSETRSIFSFSVEPDATLLPVGLQQCLAQIGQHVRQIRGEACAHGTVDHTMVV
jgi:hypothetical protein